MDNFVLALCKFIICICATMFMFALSAMFFSVSIALYKCGVNLAVLYGIIVLYVFVMSVALYKV